MGYTSGLQNPKGYRGSQSAQPPSCSVSGSLTLQLFSGSHRPQILSVPAPSGAGATQVTGQLDVGDGTQTTQKQHTHLTTAQSPQPQPIL